MEHRRMMLNIETAIDKLQTCNSVLDIVSKIYQQIQNRKYYSALRVSNSFVAIVLVQLSQVLITYFI